MNGSLIMQLFGVVKSVMEAVSNVPHSPRTSSRYELLAESRILSPSYASSMLLFGKNSCAPPLGSSNTWAINTPWDHNSVVLLGESSTDSPFRETSTSSLELDDSGLIVIVFSPRITIVSC